MSGKTNVSPGIYCIKNLINDKRYIGQTRNIERREKEHFRELNQGEHFNPHLQKSFDKYGKENFKFIVLEKCTVNELDEKEKEYISKYNTMNKENGYNLRTGGYKPLLSETSRQKISETRKERIKRGLISIDNSHLHTEKVQNKAQESIKKYYKNNPERKIELSKSKSTIKVETVRKIKMMLYLDMEIKEIHDITGVNRDKITHIKLCDTFEYIAPKLNYYIKNRSKIYKKKRAAKVLEKYRKGFSYKEIANSINVHRRTAIRIVERNKTKFDDKMRQRTKNFKKVKKYKLIKRMVEDCWGVRETANYFNVSTATIYKLKKDEYDLQYSSLPG